MAITIVHGGVALFIHQDIAFYEVQMQTPLQAVAIRIYINQPITICNVYIPGSCPFRDQQLSQILSQLAPPVLIIGDLNSHLKIWGGRVTDARRRTLEAFITNNNLSIITDGAPTLVGYHAESAIDILICSPELMQSIVWRVASSPGDTTIARLQCPT